MVRIPFLSKRKTLPVGGESVEGEPTVAVEERPKTSLDFFQEFPQGFISEFRYEEPVTRTKIERFVTELKKPNTRSVLIFRESGRTDPKGRMLETGFDQRTAEVMQRILGTKISPEVSRRGTVPTPEIDRGSWLPGGVNSQTLGFKVYPTNYTDLYVVETRDDVFARQENVPIAEQPHSKDVRMFVVKMGEDDLKPLREAKPGDDSMDLQLRRIDKDFAPKFEKADFIVDGTEE